MSSGREGHDRLEFAAEPLGPDRGARCLVVRGWFRMLPPVGACACKACAGEEEECSRDYVRVVTMRAVRWNYSGPILAQGF